MDPNRAPFPLGNNLYQQQGVAGQAFQAPQYGSGVPQHIQANVQQQIQAIGESIRASQTIPAPMQTGAFPQFPSPLAQTQPPATAQEAPVTTSFQPGFYPPPQLNPATAQFFSPYEPPHPMAAGPSDPEEAKRIDKVAEYAAKNGQQFEALMKEKQKDNPAYAFLVGGENSGYYRYKLWSLLNPHIPPDQVHLVFVPPQPQQAPFSFPNAAAPSAGFQGYPPFSPSPAATQPAPSLSPELNIELSEVLEKLTGTKESIKGTKAWFMDRVATHLSGMIAALRDRVVGLSEVDKQLHVVYLVNDILFSCLGQRTTPLELDSISLGFRPVLGQMLAAAYNNASATNTNKERLTKILHFWGSKDVFDASTIASLEKEMQTGVRPVTTPASVQPAPVSTPPPSFAHPPSPYAPPTSWTPPLQQPYPTMPPQQDSYQFGGQPFSGSAGSPSQFGAPHQGFFPQEPLQQPAMQQPPPEPDFPPFPPGLIPGMVRKMQVGSGVPYSPISPLDIPSVIPPASQSESYIISRLRKFYKEVGVGGDDLETDEFDERRPDRRFTDTKEMPMPTLNMEVNTETGVLDDGSFYGGLGSGRAGLGAAEQRDNDQDEFSSYRKARSTNYHMSIGVRTG